MHQVDLRRLPLKLLGTRAAANQLGIHENTLRRWEDRGIVRAVRLPGSSFRRYRPEDISRLSVEMFRALEHPVGADEVAPANPVVRGHHDASLWDE